MKKLISLILVCMMLASVAAVSSSAAVYYSDNFSTFNDAFWNTDATQFIISGGVLEGYRSALVQQSQFAEDENGKHIGAGTFDIFTLQFDARAVDQDASGSHHFGVRLHDYQVMFNGDSDKQDEYYFLYDPDECLYYLDLNGEVVASYSDPDQKGYTDKDWCRMGVEIELGKMICYVDGKEVMSYSSPTLGQARTMIMLWNRNCYVQFDNLVVGDASELPVGGGEDEDTPTPTDTTAPNGGENTTTTTAPVTETSIVTKVEEGTDAEGNVTTKIVSEVVTVAPADTVTGGTAGGTGASTGDMALIVVAVMIVALGTAIVVKKVNVK